MTDSPSRVGPSESHAAVAGRRHIWTWLTEPSNAIDRSDARRNARLLAGLLAGLLPLTIVSAILMALFGGSASVSVQLWVTAIPLGIAYGLSRTKYYAAGAWLILAALTYLAFVSVTLGAGHSLEGFFSTFVWVTIPLMLSGLFFSLRGVAIYSATVVLTLLLLPAAVPALSQSTVLSALGFVLSLSGISSIAIWHRDRLEADHTSKLLASHRELQDLRDSLEARAQDLERSVAQLKASVAVSRAATSLVDPAQLLRDLVNLIAARFGFYHVAIFMLDNAGMFAVLREATGEAGRALKERGHKLRVDSNSTVGYAIGQRKPRVALDVGAEPAHFADPLLPDTRSELALPLVVDDRVLGALDLQSIQPAAFDASSVAVLQGMADQVAIALDNAISYAEAESAARQARALYDASQAVGHLGSDLSATVQTMMQAVSDALGYAQWWVVTFTDERREWLAPLATSSEPSNRPVHVKDQQDTPTVRSAVYGETYIVNDPENDSRLATIPASQRADIGKFVSVPVMAREAPVGAVAFGWPMDRPDLGQRDLEVGLALANLVAVAVDNHLLFEESQRALNEVAAVNRRLTVEAWHSYLTVRPEIASESGHRGAIEGASRVSVPIVVRGETLGMLDLEDHDSTRQWTEDELALLNTVAGEVALSLENARLIEHTQRAALREKAVTEAADRIHRPVDLQTILRTAVEEVGRLTGATDIGIRMGQGAAENDSGGNGGRA